MSPHQKLGCTLRALLGIMGPQPLRPIIDPVVLVSMMDPHSQVGLVGQRRPSPDMVPVIELVEVGENACFGGEALE